MAMLLAFLFFWAAPLNAEPIPTPSASPITITYPPYGSTLTVVSATFILGHVSPSSGILQINSQPVHVHRTGGFIAYLPVQPGNFAFHCELRLPTTSYQLDHQVHIISPQPGSTTQIMIDPNSVMPAELLELRSGDWLNVQIRGTPGSEGEFSISGVKKHIPLAESAGLPGVYRASYQIQPGDEAAMAKIEFNLKHKHLGRAEATAQGRLTILTGPPRIAEVSSDLAQGETGPGDSYFMFLPKGVRLMTLGTEGARVQVFLSDTERAWLDKTSLKILPEGFPVPEAVLGSAVTASSGTSTLVTLSLSEPVPYLVRPTPEGLSLTLYYTRAHLSPIVYDTKDSFVRDIQWEQTGRRTCVLSIALDPRQTLWGYQAIPKPGGMVLELRQAPRLRPYPQSVFKGLTVVLDPGHSPRTSPPWDGAIGPLGTQEPQVNLPIAKKLQALLEKAGADVVLTRSGDEEVPLYDRPRIASQSHGDLFLSIHNNALPDGTDPFEKPRGFSVYYYHLHSKALAQKVHNAYIRHIWLPDEGLRYGNLAVARLSQMPAVLVESAYLILPEQEELLRSSWFQNRLAGALFEGAREFLQAERAKQAASLKKAKMKK